MLQIKYSSSPKEISYYIAGLREQKGKEKEVLEVIEKALGYGHNFVINLFWEEALTYQHLIMNGSIDKRARTENLLKMEATVMNAKYFIVRFHLERWKHRLYRFMGKVAEYKKQYNKALIYYRKSLKYANKDPEYVNKKFPRWLEVEAFISFSLIMSGKVETGYKLAKEVFDKFDNDKEAKLLKINDYSTWAIWKSGIPPRTVEALLAKKVNFDKSGALAFLVKAKETLSPPKGVRTWVDFSYRKQEVKNLIEELKKTS